MADWRIVTPTRAPMDDELLSVGLVLTSPGNLTIMYSQNKLGITYQNVQPVVRYFYDFTTNEWQDTSYTPIDITSVDLTIPEAAVSSATNKSSYFDLIAYEKGTTACKLAVTNEAKTLIRNALINKGVDVPDTTPFRQYAGKVGEIQTGDLPKSIKVTIYNSIRAEYDVHYFSSVSGQGPQVIHLSKESDVTFSILSDTPISIEGPQNPEPIIRDVLHSIDAVCLTTSAPGTGENYFSFSTNELFDPGKGVISLEVIDPYG